MPRKPLGWMGTICQAQDATRPKGDSQARPVAIRNATQGAFGLSKSPLRLDHAPARDLASPGLTVGKAGTDKSWTGLDSAIRKRLDLIRRET